MDASRTPFEEPESTDKSESGAREPSSATGIFGTPSPAQPQEDDLLKSLLRNENTPASPTPPGLQTTPPPAAQTQERSLPTPATLPAAPPPSAAPGGFTQMFQALTNPTPNPAPPTSPTPAATPVAQPLSSISPKPLSDLASLFTKISVEKSSLPDLPAQPTVQVPGEFTRMLRSLGNQAEQAASGTHPLPSVETTKAAASPDSFTQMFSAISANPGECSETTPVMPTPRQWAPETPPPVKPETAAAAPTGSFTRMFRPTEDSTEPSPQQPIPPVAPPESGPNTAPRSFTEIFSQRSVEKTPFDDPLNSLRPESIPERSYQFSNSPAHSSESMPPAQGGFTQLLNALNKEEPAPGKSPEPLMSPTPAPPAGSSPAAGGFTQLLRNLSAEPAPRPAGQPPIAQGPVAPPMQPVFSAPPSGGGPGEFTRVISGSAWRDLQPQGAPPVAPAAAAPARAGLPPMQMPQAAAFPQAPSMPQMPHSGAPAQPAMQQFQAAPFAFPPAPAPPPAPPAPAPSKLQQYLPLILILNVFVLLVIVLILFFVLRHR